MTNFDTVIFLVYHTLSSDDDGPLGESVPHYTFLTSLHIVDLKIYVGNQRNIFLFASQFVKPCGSHEGLRGSKSSPHDCTEETNDCVNLC